MSVNNCKMIAAHISQFDKAFLLLQQEDNLTFESKKNKKRDIKSVILILLFKKTLYCFNFLKVLTILDERQ